MRRPTPATGLRTLLAAGNILFAKMTPTVTSLLGSPATGTGPARADIPDSRDVPPCWSSISRGDGASPRPLKTVKFQQPKLLRQGRKMTIPPDLVNSLNSLPTPGEEEDRGDLLLLPETRDQLAENFFLSTFLPALSRSTKTNRENWSKRTLHQQ